MPALIIYSTTDNRLNGYRRGDVVAVVRADAPPGNAVTENSPIRFGFLYVTDMTARAASAALVGETEDENSEPGEDGRRAFLAKSAWKVPAAALGVEATTYRSYSDPLAVKRTRAQIEAAVTRKTRAEAVAQAVEVLTRKRDAVTRAEALQAAGEVEPGPITRAEALEWLAKRRESIQQRLDQLKSA